MTAQQNTRPFLASAFKIDFVLFGIVGALVAVGLVMVWSVTFGPRVSAGTDPMTLVLSQGKYALFGVVLLIVFSQLDYHFWGKLALPMMGVTLLVLASLLALDPKFGSRRWLFDGSVQPGEIAKFTIIVYIAKWLSSKGDKLRHITYGLLPFAMIVGIACGLIVLQPNISTAVIIALCALSMFFIAGADTMQFAFLLIIGGITGAVIVSQMPHALERWLKFVQDPFSLGDDGLQIVETLISLGTGGFVGRGLGAGLGKYGWIPAAHTDSIFAILGEETGLIGTLAVLALFLALAYRGFRIAARAKDPFGQVLASGLTFWLIYQAFVNVAVVTASIPFTGVPLPFISYGGSSLVAALVAVGVLLSVSRGETITKDANATFDFRWRNGGTRVSRVDRRRRDAEPRER